MFYFSTYACVSLFVRYPDYGLQYPDYLFAHLSLVGVEKRVYLCAMKTTPTHNRFCAAALVLLFAVALPAQRVPQIIEPMNTKTMNTEQESLVALAANEATGNLTALYAAVDEALDNGFTVNQLKEAFLHLYAYTGFPRSLNAQGVLQQVLSDRAVQGKTVEVGQDATPLSADYDALRQGTAVQTALCGGAYTYAFVPAEDYCLKAHLFGDLFARDVLTPQMRELLTVSALAAMEGTDPQLRSHSAIAVRAGVPEEVVAEAVSQAKMIGSRSRLTFAVGKPNTAYAAYFQGQSYLAALGGDQHPVSNVTFEPACRNNWHIHHDARQILICVSGEGWYQEWGKPAQRLKAGDVIDIPVGVKHWHGATRDSWFQHVVFHIPVPQEEVSTAEPNTVRKTGNEWLEPVSDEDYNRLP